MKDYCLKCGIETNYKGDLHCRQIFFDKVKQLVLLKKIKEAKCLYFSEPFDEKWKMIVLSKIGGVFQTQVLDELNKQITEERHKDYLLSLGKKYSGISISSQSKKHRITHCYNCKEVLDNSTNLECNTCGWIICQCGACGCGYSKE